MNNPLIEKMPSGNDFLTRFMQFRKEFQGDPKQMIQNMLNSGQITQEQLNNAMNKANQLMRFIK
jgi:hypothetical protein